MAEHNIRHLPQGAQLPRPPVNDRLPRAGPRGELGVKPTREWVRRRLGLGALERVVVPRTFGAQPTRRPRRRRSRRRPRARLQPPGSTSSPPRRSHDLQHVADCADTTFYLLQPFEHATVAGCADCLLGIVASSRRPRASLALLAVVCPAGVECIEVIEGDHVDADRLSNIACFARVCVCVVCVCVCIPRRQQHFEIERATGAAASGANGYRLWNWRRYTLSEAVCNLLSACVNLLQESLRLFRIRQLSIIWRLLCDDSTASIRNRVNFELV